MSVARPLDRMLLSSYGHRYSDGEGTCGYDGRPAVSDSQEGLHVRHDLRRPRQLVRQDHVRAPPAQPSQAASPAAHPMLDTADRDDVLPPELAQLDKGGRRFDYDVRLSLMIHPTYHTLVMRDNEGGRQGRLSVTTTSTSGLGVHILV